MSKADGVGVQQYKVYRLLCCQWLSTIVWVKWQHWGEHPLTAAVAVWQFGWWILGGCKNGTASVAIIVSLWYDTLLHWTHILHLCLGFVHPLQDVALHQCLLLSSVCCFPNLGGSLLCYVVLPSSAWSSSWSLPSPWLPLCAAFGPPIVLNSCYLTGLFPLLFQCVFYDISHLCSFPDFWAWYLIL